MRNMRVVTHPPRGGVKLWTASARRQNPPLTQLTGKPLPHTSPCSSLFLGSSKVNYFAIRVRRVYIIFPVVPLPSSAVQRRAGVAFSSSSALRIIFYIHHPSRAPYDCYILSPSGAIPFSGGDKSDTIK